MACKSPSSTEMYTDDKDVVIDIYQKLEKLTRNRTSDVVCISQVPNSLSFVKPKAFNPQFVGLGPYHHFDPNLTMLDDMKLSVATRVLEDFLPEEHGEFDNRLTEFVSNIEAFYHTYLITRYNHPTLLHLLIIDGLFLLALVRGMLDVLEIQHYSSYIITGKQSGMPLVNDDGVELTMESILRDVFMLENQIPTPVLILLSLEKIDSYTIGSIMNHFCLVFGPVVHPQELSKEPEAYDHLLDLMYHLIAPQIEPVPVPVPVPEPQPARLTGLRKVCIYCILYILLLFWFSVYILKFILQLFLILLRLVSTTIRLLLSPISNQLNKEMPPLSDSLSRWIEIFHDSLSVRAERRPHLRPYLQIVRNVRDRWFRGSLVRHSTNSDNVAPSAAANFKFPSATKLHEAGIHVKFDEGGISSIRFDMPNSQFYLPCIRLDVISEVIIRNLMAYESLANPRHLIFTWYIQLMCALINTSEDVKLLIHEKIIQTQLSDEVVTQLFNEMSKSIEHTKIPRMEEVIKKVKTEFNRIQNLKWFWNEFMYPILIFSIAIVAIVVLGLLYCPVFPNLKYYIQPKVGDYGRNNYFISDM